MQAIRLCWKVISLDESTRHVTQTPIGIIQIVIFKNDRIEVNVFNCSSYFRDYIKDTVDHWTKRTDVSLGHIKQLIQCLYNDFIYTECCTLDR